MVDFSLQNVAYGLIILGIVLFIVEAMAPGFFVAVPATILLILGGFALVVPDFSLFTFWAPIITLGVGVPATVATILVYRRIAPPLGEPTTQTGTNLVGQVGKVTARVVPDEPQGRVTVSHQSFSAVTRGAPIPVDAKVRIVDVDGVILVVQPLE